MYSTYTIYSTDQLDFTFFFVTELCFVIYSFLSVNSILFHLSVSWIVVLYVRGLIVADVAFCRTHFKLPNLALLGKPKKKKNHKLKSNGPPKSSSK